MARRLIAGEFRLEAVRLVHERGAKVAEAARGPEIHENVLRKWVRDYAADPGHAFPGAGQQKPEQAEVAMLKREIRKLKAERDILKTAAAYFASESKKVRFYRKASGDLAVAVVMRRARCLAERVLQLVVLAAAPARQYQR